MENLTGDVYNTLQNELAKLNQRRTQVERSVEQAKSDLEKMLLELKVLNDSITRYEGGAALVANLSGTYAIMKLSEEEAAKQKETLGQPSLQIGPSQPQAQAQGQPNGAPITPQAQQTFAPPQVGP